MDLLGFFYRLIRDPATRKTAMNWVERILIVLALLGTYLTLSNKHNKIFGIFETNIPPEPSKLSVRQNNDKGNNNNAGRDLNITTTTYNYGDTSKRKSEDKKKVPAPAASLQFLQKTLDLFLEKYPDRKTNVSVDLVGASNEEMRSFGKKMVNLIKMNGYERVNVEYTETPPADNMHKQPYLVMKDSIVMIYIPCP